MFYIAHYCVCERMAFVYEPKYSKIESIQIQRATEQQKAENQEIGAIRLPSVNVKIVL